MKALLIGLGQIGLGLIAPVFQKAGYAIVGTDANQTRLDALRNGYFLETPSGTVKIEVDVVSMPEVTNTFDFVITSVGRQHLAKVAAWCAEKGITAPVLMAENLPDLVNLFSCQISIVVDRICPRIEMRDGLLMVVAEDYYKIVALGHATTRQLGTVAGVELEGAEADVEQARKQKMFTVNTAHVLTALFGQQFGCALVEEAVAHPEVASRIRTIISEVAPWLGFDSDEAEKRANGVIERFANPIHDPLSRILSNRTSALRYVEVPLNGLRLMGFKAPMLEEARALLSS